MYVDQCNKLSFTHLYKKQTNKQTDASKLRTQSTGAGIWQVHGNSTTEESWYLGQYMEVFDAELWALWKGLEIAKDYLKRQSNKTPGSLPSEADQLIKNIYLFSDGQSALARIDNLAPRPGQALIHEIYQAVQRITRIYRVNIQFEWIPGHFGIPGNERADEAAKRGAKNEGGRYPNVGYTSFTYVGVAIKQSCLDDWKSHCLQVRDANKNSHYFRNFLRFTDPKQRRYWKPRVKPCKVIAPKSYYAALNQLKTGHGYFRSYLAKRSRNHQNNTCFGQCTDRYLQSPAHLLLSCPTYRKQRAELYKTFDINRSSLSLSGLLGTETIYKFTLNFIQATGISTRAWMNSHTNQ